jgi:ribosomal protein L16/L10AE
MKFLKQDKLNFMQRSLMKKTKQNTSLSTHFCLFLIAVESKVVSSNELKTLYNTINKLLKKQNKIEFKFFVHLN